MQTVRNPLRGFAPSLQPTLARFLGTAPLKSFAGVVEQRPDHASSKWSLAEFSGSSWPTLGQDQRRQTCTLRLAREAGTPCQATACFVSHARTEFGIAQAFQPTTNPQPDPRTLPARPDRLLRSNLARTIDTEGHPMGTEPPELPLRLVRRAQALPSACA